MECINLVSRMHQVRMHLCKYIKLTRCSGDGDLDAAADGASQSGGGVRRLAPQEGVHLAVGGTDYRDHTVVSPSRTGRHRIQRSCSG